MDGVLFFTQLPRDVLKMILRYLIGGTTLIQYQGTAHIIRRMETACFRLPYFWNSENVACFKVTCKTIAALVRRNTTRSFTVPKGSPVGGHWVLQVKR